MNRLAYRIVRITYNQISSYVVIRYRQNIFNLFTDGLITVVAVVVIVVAIGCNIYCLEIDIEVFLVISAIADAFAFAFDVEEDKEDVWEDECSDVAINDGNNSDAKQA
ncbi:hypothetical protein CHS0354_022589 [Potamilus streckersoni]|uniref:Uncharacterized protein n=1 Tax=Potamilus streckersoni TaxID=2493646 RepID=A0AAE0SUH9_9BIVA|nr:hypothetical protein CHS0354_022589 [Potamilus streckersoni]